MEAMENRQKPFSILFVDHERLVVGMESQSCTFFANEEYGIKLSFSIKRGPILTRDIFVTCLVNKIYRSRDGLYSCVDFRYTTLQEEDMRFLYEKATSTLFNQQNLYSGSVLDFESGPGPGPVVSGHYLSKLQVLLSIQYSHRQF